MFYYWLIPVLVLALVAVAMFSSAARRKRRSTNAAERPATEPIRRGRYLNK